MEKIDIAKEVEDFSNGYFKGVELKTLINLSKHPINDLCNDIVDNIHCDDNDQKFVLSLMSMMTILTVKKCKTYFTIKGFSIGAIIGILFMYFMG